MCWARAIVPLEPTENGNISRVTERNRFRGAPAVVPRFYFHLLNDVDAPDEEGKELPDLDAAREQARMNVRFTAGETLKEQGRIVLGHRIEIEDEDGNVLDTVYFSDVLQIDE
jgi:hypothetical protein